MTKPLVFNYSKYEELREAYKQLLEDNQRLVADNRRLRKENNNYRIRLRIMESDDDRENNL